MLKKDKMVSYETPGCINQADNNSDIIILGTIIIIIIIIIIKIIIITIISLSCLILEEV